MVKCSENNKNWLYFDMKYSWKLEVVDEARETHMREFLKGQDWALSCYWSAKSTT